MSELSTYRKANTDQESHGESLAFTLSLTIDGKQYSIPGANIKHCRIQAFSNGFTSTVGFYLPNDQRDDTLVKSYVKESLITVELQAKAVHNLPDPAPKAIVLKGLVTEKSLSEKAYRQVSGAPVLYRYYQCAFADPARVLWKQHYPSELYVDDTLSSVINAQVVSPIELTIDFATADDTKPLICLSLGNTDTHHHGETGTTNQASFYDFLMDYLACNNGFLNYDYETNSYTISADEAPLQTSKAFLPYEVSTIESYWPETSRSVVRLLNGTTDNSKQEDIDNDQSVEGIKRDIMLRHTIESRYTDRKDAETNRQRQRGQQLSVFLSQWPMQDFWPHKSFSMNKSADGNTFLHTDTTYRVNSLAIVAEALDDSPEHDIDLDFTQYQLSYRVNGHDSESPQPVFPAYNRPRYPAYVEGVIVSEQGEDDEKTYDVPSNDDTGQFEYKVHVPLWDLTIKLLLEPDYLNPHFFFPFYRDTRLLLGFDLYRAHVIRVLSWGKDVQLPMATQGNHILFGKKAEDQTSMTHVYEDSKPVLAIKRTKDNDTELVQLEEGSLILQTCEEE